MENTPSDKRGGDAKRPQDQSQQAGNRNNGRSASQNRGTGSQHKRHDNKPKPSKKVTYVGHTEELKEFVITDTGNKITQFREMYARVYTYASTEYSSDVATSLEELSMLNMTHFMPEPLDSNLYTNSDGTEDSATKEVLTSMQTQLVKDKTSEYTSYKSGLKSMFDVIYGQVDDNVKSTLAGLEQFPDTKRRKDPIELISMIREICYRDSNTRIHRMTHLVRLARKLLTSRQRDEDAGEYVRGCKERFNVFKASGGNLLFPETINAFLAYKGKSRAEYKAMDPATKIAFDKEAEEAFLAAIIIEGSSEETSTLKRTLAQQFSMESDRYPTTTTRATELLNEFEGTKDRKRQSQNKKNSNKNGPDSSSNNSKTGSINVNNGEIACDPNNEVKYEGPEEPNQDDTWHVEGQQVLMSAIATDERFNHDEAVFFQYGEVSNNISDDDEDNDYEPNDLFSQTSDDADTDWDFWVAKDTADSEANRHADVTLVAPSPPPAEVDVPDRSEDSSAHGDTTTLTTESGTTTSPNSSNESSLGKRKGNNKHRERERRPDPPGLTADQSLYARARRQAENSRSEHDKNCRSDRHTWKEWKNPRSGAPQSRVRGHDWTSLAALDLAVTKWQSEAIIGQEQFRYNQSVQHMFAQHRGGIDPNWILLDSESSVNLIVNKDLLENIRVAPNKGTLTVHCNAGRAVTNKIGELKGFGTVWYYEDGIANVISLGLITNRFRVTMDSSIDNAIYVHKDNGDIRRFHRGPNNLYYYDTKEGNTEGTLLTITTVEGQKELFSGVDRKRAERAHKLQEIVGYPSDKDFLKMIDNKVLANCTVTRRDVQMAKQIYGRHKSIAEGKTVRRQVPHVREDISPIPHEILKTYKDITLCCDVLYVNGVRFFVTISKHLKFRTVWAIENARRNTILSCVKATVGQYSARGFIVKTVFADNQFGCIRDDLLQLSPPVCMNLTSSDEHEPFVERSIRTLKERIRCGYSSVPFQRMPIRMIAELVYCCVFWLNSYIPKDGVSAILSPREIMTGVSLDANKHARYQFGEYIMAHNDETNNSMDARTRDTIYLRPSGNRQGGFFVFDLKTARRLHRMHGTPAPMSEGVIGRVEEIAKDQGAPQGLVFGDRNNNSTVHDFEEDENVDDDDASDGSYDPADADDRSVETELTGVITESSETSETMTNHDAVQDEHAEGPPAEDDEPSDNGDERAAIENDGGSDEEIAQVSDGEDVPGTDENEEDNVQSGNESEVEDMTQADNEDLAPTNGDMDENTRGTESEGTRMTLRATVKRTHNKFGESDGYTSKTIHRGSMFTAGYGPAMSELVNNEIGYIHAAAAIMQYNNLDASQVTKQYGVRQGIKMFGDEGVDAVLKELKQLHDRVVVVPMDPNKMTKEMRDKALPYLMFLKRKRCGKIKGRGCADGRRQREFISKEEASSPTVSLHALMISCLIDAIEERDVATADIPGAFLQTDMPDDEEVYIRLDGTMAELLCRLDPDLYNPCMIDRNGRKTLFARAKKAIYGTLRAALLFWENLSGVLGDWGFEPNPYDRCTMNKMIDGHQATICWHVDDLKISHKHSNVVSELLDMLNKEFGKISPLTVTRGKIHDYVGMTIDYSEKQKVKFSMFDYLEDIIQGLPKEFVGEANTPAGNHLFTIDEDSDPLDQKQADTFHHYVAKLLFMAKRTRPDIATAVAFLCTRVKSPDIHDWKKLGRVMKYLQLTPFIPLNLGWDGSGDVHWYVDASFAVHRDMRSHTGGVMTLGQGAVVAISTKQKINTKSSTEAELVGVDDVLNLQVWSRYFINSQYEHSGGDLLRKKDRLYQDNTSSIKLEKNGKASSTRRTRHIDIRYFFITDRVKSGNIDIEYCPTEEMLADFFTKPLQGKLYRTHRNTIQGISEEEYFAYKDAYYDAKRNNCPASAVSQSDGNSTS